MTGRAVLATSLVALATASTLVPALAQSAKPPRAPAPADPASPEEAPTPEPPAAVEPTPNVPRPRPVQATPKKSKKKRRGSSNTGSYNDLMNQFQRQEQMNRELQLRAAQIQ